MAAAYETTAPNVAIYIVGELGRQISGFGSGVALSNRRCEALVGQSRRSVHMCIYVHAKYGMIYTCTMTAMMIVRARGGLEGGLH
eukprot:8432323-Pyramimonas_sp.AAC.1